jgi:hypothetical protein
MMGVVFSVLFFLVCGGLILLSWHSIDLICQCAALNQDKAQGVIGLSVVIGITFGLIATALWD